MYSMLSFSLLIRGSACASEACASEACADELAVLDTSCVWFVFTISLVSEMSEVKSDSGNLDANLSRSRLAMSSLCSILCNKDNS